MKLDSSLVINFIKQNKEKNLQHWIFKSIVTDEFCYEDVLYEEIDNIENTYNIFMEELVNFKPLNKKYWDLVFDDFAWSDISNTLYLVVGLPNPYDALVLEDNAGKDCIIFDLNRINQYSQDSNETRKLINNFLTHEIAHIYIRTKLKMVNKDNYLELLKFIFIDEGLSHLLSYCPNIDELDFNTEEMIKRKHLAYSRLKYYLEAPDKIEWQTILDSFSGEYWSKFAAIAGMFAIKEFYFDNNNCYGIFDNSVNKCLLETVLKMK